MNRPLGVLLTLLADSCGSTQDGLPTSRDFDDYRRRLGRQEIAGDHCRSSTLACCDGVVSGVSETCQMTDRRWFFVEKRAWPRGDCGITPMRRMGEGFISIEDCRAEQKKTKVNNRNVEQIMNIFGIDLSASIGSEALFFTELSGNERYVPPPHVKWSFDHGFLRYANGVVVAHARSFPGIEKEGSRRADRKKWVDNHHIWPSHIDSLMLRDMRAGMVDLSRIASDVARQTEKHNKSLFSDSLKNARMLMGLPAEGDEE